MRTLLAVALLAAGANAGTAADHLVAPDLRDARLLHAGRLRAQDLATVNGLLESPGAQHAVATIGVEVGRVRSALGTLSDAELRDLSLRVQALESDPSAGLSSSTNDILIVVLIVLIVLLVLKAV